METDDTLISELSNLGIPASTQSLPRARRKTLGIRGFGQETRVKSALRGLKGSNLKVKTKCLE